MSSKPPIPPNEPPKKDGSEVVAPAPEAPQMDAPPLEAPHLESPPLDLPTSSSITPQSPPKSFSKAKTKADPLKDLQEQLGLFKERLSRVPLIKLITLPESNLKEEAKISSDFTKTIFEKNPTGGGSKAVSMLNISPTSETNPIASLLDYINLKTGIRFTTEELKALRDKTKSFHEDYEKLAHMDEAINQTFQEAYKNRKTLSEDALSKVVSDLKQALIQLNGTASKIEEKKKELHNHMLELRKTKKVNELLSKGSETKKIEENPAILEAMGWFKHWIEACYAAVSNDELMKTIRTSIPSVSRQMGVFAAKVIYHPYRYPSELVRNIEMNLENLGADPSVFKRETHNENEFAEFVMKRLDDKKTGFSNSAVFKQMTKTLEELIKNKKQLYSTTVESSAIHGIIRTLQAPKLTAENKQYINELLATLGIEQAILMKLDEAQNFSEADPKKIMILEEFSVILTKTFKEKKSTSDPKEKAALQALLTIGKPFKQRNEAALAMNAEKLKSHFKTPTSPNR